MSAAWDDEYLTVKEIADRLKLNQQTVRNWIELGSLLAVRVGRRVRVRRADLDRVLAQGATVELEPEAPIVAPAEAVEQLTEALERSRRLLGRLTGARRSDLTEGLQDLTDAVAATLRALSDDSTPPDSDSSDVDPSDGDSSDADHPHAAPPGPAAPADTE
ncbi:MAG: helix-turn-helix domain-containing protein [Solirubrobacteraceae bacterium]